MPSFLAVKPLRPLHRIWNAPLVQTILNNYLIVLLPVFIAGRIRPERKIVHKIHPTSYLDGLRGIAASVVLSYHYTDYNHKWAYPSSKEDWVPDSILHHEFIRVLISGTPMVHIFFVISGFALSYGPLRSLYSLSSAESPRSHGIVKTHQRLVSAIFRRPLRLFGPAITQAFITLSLSHMGYLQHYMKPKPWLQHLKHLAHDVIYSITWPWSWETTPRSHYNPHLWTISVEFVHSLVLFMLIFAFSHLAYHRYRHIAYAFVMYYALFVCGHWATFNFVGGALIADWYLYLDNKAVSHSSSSGCCQSKIARLIAYPFQVISSNRLFSILTHTVTPLAVLVFAGYAFSSPSRQGDVNAEWKAFGQYSPAIFKSDTGFRGFTFWHSIGAVCSVWAIGRLGFVRRVLETGPIQYLGKISFGLYILQHPILNTCATPILGAPPQPARDDKPAVPGWGVRGFFGTEPGLGRDLGWLTALLALFVILIWAADVFWRLVDMNFVKLARKLEALTFHTEESEVNDKEALLPTSSK